MTNTVSTPEITPVAKLEAKSDLPEDQRQVNDQCRAVVHMANALASVHVARASILDNDPRLQEVIGQSTAYVMEQLGNILSNIDAVDDEADAWMDEIFERAQVRFPQGVAAAPVPAEGSDTSIAGEPGALMAHAQQYWKGANRRHPGAVQWAQDETGALLIFTRGEHRKQLLMAIDDATAAPPSEVVEALKMAIRQNSHDMLMTGDEIRQCEAALRASPASIAGEREAFEEWYVADALRQTPDLSVTVEGLRALRVGDSYGYRWPMLTGKWQGWQARAALRASVPAGEAG